MSRNGVYIIAEAGVNHNGSEELALRLVEEAAACGADAVKFQTFRAKRLLTKQAPKAGYQLETTDATESQFEMIRKLELPEKTHRILLNRCRELGIEFLSTPFDEESLRFLAEDIGVARLKIPSGEITNAPLLLAAARSGLPVILSTGMSTLTDIEMALGVLAFGYGAADRTPSRAAFAEAYASAAGETILKEKVTLLHCTTEYPAPVGDVNLKAMATIARAFGIPVGLSDHTEGIGVAIAATALGATVVEKHFTLDRNLPGPDHRASLEPHELKAMVDGIRQAEAALGRETKRPSAGEAKVSLVARKSLIAAAAIRRGERFTPDNLGAKRPGTGVSPVFYWDYIGSEAKRDYAEDELID